MVLVATVVPFVVKSNAYGLNQRRFPQVPALMTGTFRIWRESSRLYVICQDQQQDHDKKKSETTAAIVPGAVKGSATPVSEAAEHGDDKDYDEEGAERHDITSESKACRQRLSLQDVP